MGRTRERETVPDEEGAGKLPTGLAPVAILYGASVRWAAQSCARAGLAVLGLDRFGDRETLAACQSFRRWPEAESLPAALAGWANARGLTAVCVGGCFGETAETDDVRGAGAGGASLGESDGRLRGLRNPVELKRLAQDAGLDFPETEWLSPGEPIRSKNQASGGGERWLVKEVNGTGGLGVRWLDRATACGTGGLGIEPSAWVQRFVLGRPLGLVALADRRRVRILGVCGSFRVRLGNRPFVYAGSWGPCRFSQIGGGFPWLSMQRLAESVAATAGVRGLFNIDLVRDRDGRCWVLEVNPRPSGSCEIHERAWTARGRLAADDSLMRWHWEAISGATPTDEIPQETWPTGANSDHASWDYACGHFKRVLFARRAGMIGAAMIGEGPLGQGSVPARVPVGSSWTCELVDVPAKSTPVQRGAPLLTVLIDGPASASIGDWRRCWRSACLRVL